jgi:hypothetical protein
MFLNNATEVIEEVEVDIGMIEMVVTIEIDAIIGTEIFKHLFMLEFH